MDLTISLIGWILLRAHMRRVLKYFSLLAPCGLALAVPLYNSIEPRLFGFPLFYWFLLIMIPLSSLFIYAAYKGDGY
jgi:hypothetical protein